MMKEGLCGVQSACHLRNGNPPLITAESLPFHDIMVTASIMIARVHVPAEICEFLVDSLQRHFEVSEVLEAKTVRCGVSPRLY